MDLTKIMAIAMFGLLTATGCKKDDDATAPTPTPTPTPTYPITGPASFSLSADGTGVLYQDAVSGYTNEQTDVTSTGTASYASLFSNTTLSEQGASIYFYGETFPGSQPTDAEFYAFFAEGTKSYGILSSTTTGVSVSYRSGSQNYWSLQVPQPAASTFTITDSEPVDDGSGITKVKIRATFNCKVVSTSSGTMRTVTNGIFVGTFAKS